MEKINLSDKIELKKQHPCGSYVWEVVRVGADMKIKCIKCGRVVMIDRPTLLKRLKRVLHNSNE